jgi:hypothetical protein
MNWIAYVLLATTVLGGLGLIYQLGRAKKAASIPAARSGSAFLLSSVFYALLALAYWFAFEQPLNTAAMYISVMLVLSMAQAYYLLGTGTPPRLARRGLDAFGRSLFIMARSAVWFLLLLVAFGGLVVHDETVLWLGGVYTFFYIVTYVVNHFDVKEAKEAAL